jgi:hypothetical protein
VFPSRVHHHRPRKRSCYSPSRLRDGVQPLMLSWADLPEVHPKHFVPTTTRKGISVRTKKRLKNSRQATDLLALIIQCRSRFIKYQYLRIAHNGSCNCYPLLLPTCEVEITKESWLDHSKGNERIPNKSVASPLSMPPPAPTSLSYPLDKFMMNACAFAAFAAAII